MGKSTTVSAPQPSSQETLLLQQIMDQLTEQQQYNDMMLPEYAHQLHYKIEDVAATPYQYSASEQQTIDQYNAAKANYDSAKATYERAGQMGGGNLEAWKRFQDAQATLNSLQGGYDQLQQKAKTYSEKTTQKWTKMSDEEWYNSDKTTDLERQQWDIAQETASRQLKALRGELPLTESLQQQKAKEFEQMKNTYGISGDTVDNAVANDTIGTQNLSEFKKRWNALEEQERYGQLASGTQQTIQATGLTSDIANRNIGSLAGIGGVNSNVTSGYYSLLNPYMAYQQAGYQAAAQNQATKQQMYGSLLGTGGMLGAAAIISSKKFKTDIKTKSKKEEDKALRDVTKTRSVEYKYKKGMGLGMGKHTGAIAEEVPSSIANTNRTAINLEKKLELVSMAIKSLDRKVQRLGAEA